MTYQDYMAVQGAEDLSHLFKEDGSINYLWLAKLRSNDRVFLLKMILTKEEWESEIFGNCVTAIVVEKKVDTIVRTLSIFWGVSMKYIERRVKEAKRVMGLR